MAVAQQELLNTGGPELAEGFVALGRYSFRIKLEGLSQPSMMMDPDEYANWGDPMREFTYTLSTEREVEAFLIGLEAAHVSGSEIAAFETGMSFLRDWVSVQGVPHASIRWSLSDEGSTRHGTPDTYRVKATTTHSASLQRDFTFQSLPERFAFCLAVRSPVESMQTELDFIESVRGKGAPTSSEANATLLQPLNREIRAFLSAKHSKWDNSYLPRATRLFLQTQLLA